MDSNDLIGYIYVIGCVVSLIMVFLLTRGYKRLGYENFEEFPAMCSFMALASWLNVIILLMFKEYRHVLFEGLKYGKRDK